MAAAASGRRLPTLAVTLAYVAACGGDRTDLEARWRTLAADETPAVAGTDADCGRADGGCAAPYHGLVAYESSDAEWFFGRDELIDDLVGRPREWRLLAAFGPSGVGKSSLLRAGLVPALSRDG
jgi:hypothetical protein